ncbi:MAG: CapA family protein [Burkholderiales bacterium]|nr:CapA family protein [Burkholderiales bacterium]
MIADYQPIVAEAAFAAGAGLILGHHAHAPKAIGVHNSKVCFYGLSNFIISTNITKRWMAKTGSKTDDEGRRAFARRYGVTLDPDHPLPYGTDGKRSLIAKAMLMHDGVK